MRSYWDREELIYCGRPFAGRRFAKDATSVLDVGSRACHYRLVSGRRYRTSLDSRALWHRSVQSIESDFYSGLPTGTTTWCSVSKSWKRFRCAGLRKKLSHPARRQSSAFYKWPEATQFHIHDPVDEAKLSFGSDEPNLRYICKEGKAAKSAYLCYDSIPDLVVAS
jgi:hypothetical protein